MKGVTAMFNKTYFSRLIKSNTIFFVFTGVLCGLIAIIMAVFTPETMEQISASSADLPINPLGDISTLLSFIGNQYFGMMALIFPMIYLIMTANKIIAAAVDKGDMACHLSTPVTRMQITCTSAIYLIGSLIVMYVLIGAVGSGVAALVQPGELDYGVFFKMLFGSFLLQLAISGVAFCASCVFNSTKRSLIFGAGVPIFFFATNLLSGMSDKLEPLKYTSLITLFDTKAIIDGGGYALQFTVLVVIGLALYVVGIFAFRKKDLPL